MRSVVTDGADGEGNKLKRPGPFRSVKRAVQDDSPPVRSEKTLEH